MEDCGMLDGLLRRFQKEKPVESLCELWQARRGALAPECGR